MWEFGLGFKKGKLIVVFGLCSLLVYGGLVDMEMLCDGCFGLVVLF